MAKLKVIREKSFIGKIRGMNLFVDGQKVGKIANGKDQDFEVPDGNHTFKCMWNWGFASSKDYPFTVSGNETKTVFISPSVPLLIALIVPAGILGGILGGLIGGILGGGSEAEQQKMQLHQYGWLYALLIVFMFAISYVFRKYFIIIKDF